MRQFLVIGLVLAMLVFGCAGSQPAAPAPQQAQPAATGQQPPAGSNQRAFRHILCMQQDGRGVDLLQI